MIEVVLVSGYIDSKSRQVSGCCIVALGIWRHRKLEVAMHLDGSKAGDASCQLSIVS